MRVVDLFCGAGGFSEGFRQAGFDIIFGVDIWRPALLTFIANQSTAKTVGRNIKEISILPDHEFDSVIPDSEIIIGSPPCVDFSHSNKSGKADKTKGIELIKSFFRIVARKKFKKNSILKYWLFENVPNVQSFVQSQYSAKDLDLTGDFILIVKNGKDKVFDAQMFGVPSRRKRYICGEFLEPSQEETALENIPLRKILELLGEPCTKIDNLVIDPNYPTFTMPAKKITDYHYIQKLARFEWETAKRLKLDKGYMGRMTFPEDIDKPSRTIMATMTLSARESMIFSYGLEEYRGPTIREIASLMSFPIDYIFFGDSIRLKYRLVGNAVPPKLSYRFAKSIALKEGMEVPNSYISINHRNLESYINFNFKEIPLNQETNILPTRRFKYHIPYMKIHQFRVELTNHHSDFKEKKFKWDVEIHWSQGPAAKIFLPKIDCLDFLAYELLSMENFINLWRNKISKAAVFQKIYCLKLVEREEQGLIGPLELLDIIKQYLDGLDGKFNFDRKISIKESPYPLPLKIAMGYFVLSNLVSLMAKE